jgi:hypothetical protein
VQHTHVNLIGLVIMSFGYLALFVISLPQYSFLVQRLAFIFCFCVFLRLFEDVCAIIITCAVVTSLCASKSL